jgi:hypothetical protein
MKLQILSSERHEKPKYANSEWLKIMESANKRYLYQLNGEINATKVKLFTCLIVGCSSTTLSQMITLMQIQDNLLTSQLTMLIIIPEMKT